VILDSLREGKRKRSDGSEQDDLARPVNVLGSSFRWMRRDEGNEVSNWCGEDMDYSELFPRVSKLVNVWGYSKVATPAEKREGAGDWEH
jgi:hypothetical protein